MAFLSTEKSQECGEVHVKRERLPSPEAMDTNNNNNLEAADAPLETTSAGISRLQQRPSDFPQNRTTPGCMRNARYVQSKNQAQFSNAVGREVGLDASGKRPGTEILRSLISPDISQTGTPTSLSQLIPNLNSVFSLEGCEFATPMGSGTFSPQAIDKPNRKRSLSISPLSSSSLDFNSLIRTSPNSLVNYITNSRSSSAGSIGHLSPSLFTNTNMHQQSHSRQVQVSLRSGNYPTSMNTASNCHFSNQQNPPCPVDVDGGIQIKKELDTSPPSNFPEGDGMVKMEGFSHDGIFEGCRVNIKMEPGMQGTALIPPPLIPIGLETVQEEPIGIHVSEEEEIMHSDQTDYSLMLNGNECEYETKLGIIDNLGSEHDKQKRVYYNYPSVEEPHNNHCRWADCNKQCEDLDDLVRHVNTDHIYRDSRKEFICHWMGCVREKKPFKAQYMLLVHMRRHTGEKPHKCTYEDCTKAYSRLENLKTHLRSHTGERPYVCKYEGCGKAFSNASDCAKHMNRTHSNEKPYACPNPGCTKRYTDPSSRRKHMKNCQVNKKARTDDTDAMSGADEESSAETANLKSSNTAKKTGKSRKIEKRKPTTTTAPSIRGGGFALGGLSGDYGYASGGSQGYVSGNSQGYVSSQTGYISSGCDTEYPGLQEEEISRILQEQRLSDPADISTKHHMTSSMLSQQPTHHFQSPPFQMSPSTQYSNLSPSQHFMASSSTTSRHLLPGELPALNNGQQNGDFLATINRSKNNQTASSGYSSFRSFSPPKARKSPDDIDGSSIISSSIRSSNLTNSFSTFSSNSSRVSSPCSNSDPLRINQPGSPGHSLGLFPSSQILGTEVTGFHQKHSLQPGSSYSNPRRQHTHHIRHHSDEFSIGSRPWQFSSQSSRYSYSGSELSDDLLDNLPTDVRRDSFSKNTPLPLPESMQSNFNNRMGMGFGNGEHSIGFSQHQNGFMDHSNPTMPLRHIDNAGENFSSPHSSVFSQDGSHLSGEGIDTYITMMHHHMSPNNMIVGDMESFANTLSEETQYFENFLHGQINNQVK